MENPDSILSKVCSPDLQRQIMRKLGCVGSKKVPPPKNALRLRATSKEKPKKMTPQQPDTPPPRDPMSLMISGSEESLLARIDEKRNTDHNGTL
eukprot:11535840-Karenia_brevis.AAC.1